MRRNRILILGGTRDAREIASALHHGGHRVITSLAGVTENPVLPEGDVRRGGFGGTGGLQAYLQSEPVALVIDATHPFAARMSAQAHEACSLAGLPLFRFERPAWLEEPGDRWQIVQTIAEAANCLPQGARVLLTIGRKEVAPFFARTDIGGVARMIEAPPLDPPAGWTVLQERPPFSIASETALMNQHGITHLVTKNAGGTETVAKLTAARQLSLPVVMIARPGKPGSPLFLTKDALIRAVEGVLCP